MKNILLLTAAASLLTACGASTGGLQNAMAQKVASQAVATAISKQQTVIVAPDPVVVSTADVETDTGTTTAVVLTKSQLKKCQNIATKMVATELKIQEANAVITGGNGPDVGGIAAAAATQGALHSGAAQAIGKVPFGGLFAKAAMDGMANSGKKKVAKAQRNLQKATLEKAKLEGMYAGRGCS